MGIDMISTLRYVERMQSITSKVETHQSFILFQNFYQCTYFYIFYVFHVYQMGIDMISTLRYVERMQSITSKVETHQSFILFQNFFIHCISISYSM